VIVTAASTTVPPAKTVLVADDTAFVRDRFATALQSAGHTAVPVGSVTELLARLRDDSAPVDLVVMDLRMPSSGGVELVRRLRNTEGGERVPVLVFSV
jgi:CheY-like chemotaxis protein